jgi:alcohol dehydrogenase
MRAIQLREPRRFEVLDLPEPPPPGPGEALIATHRMGVCGTDLAGYLGKMPFFTYPRIPGHELGVEVLDVGPGVTNVRPGDRCAVEPYLNCQTCYACRRGGGNCCQNLKVFGVMTDGGLRERCLIRADKLHPSPSLSYEQLALVETLAIGCHACQRGRSVKGDQVLIIGAGPIGLAALEFVRLSGAVVTVMDLVPARLEFCRRRYDIAHTLLADAEDLRPQMLEITGGALYPVVIDATGNAASMSQALHYVAHTGTLVYVGITTGEVRFSHPVLHRPEITLKASRNALPNDFRCILRWMEDGTIDTQPWITHRTPMDRLIDEFESYTRPETGVLKAMVAVTP